MLNDLSFNITPLFPAWAIAALAAALCLLLVQGSFQLLRKKVPGRWVMALAILRAAIVVVLVLCLLQPVLSYTRSTERRPDLLVMVDTSQSMGIPTSPQGKTRLDAAVDTLRQGELLENLQERFTLHFFAFDRDASPLEQADLKGLKADGDSTRFADSLSTAFAYQRQATGDGVQAAPARALLVSDGNDLGGADVVAAAQKLGLPVDTLAPPTTGDTEAAKQARVVIATVQSPRTVRLGSETQIVATLRADGAPRGALQLSLVEGGQTLASQAVTFAADSPEQTVRLVHRPQAVGLRQYELHLSTDPAATAAPTVAAPYPFSVRVIDDQKQVLILEDNWRWGFKFLRRVIEDDPSFSFTAFLSRGRGMHAQFAEADRTVGLASFPQNRADLLWFDTIVLGDVVPARWPPALAGGLAQMVKDEGKSLVIIAGPNLADLAAVPELNALLPVEVTGESATPIAGPIDVRPSREGAASAFFHNLSGGALPALDRIYPPLRKRPAATILLEAAGHANAYGNLIVMAEHTVGRGRVLFVGTDALWNWQMLGTLNGQGVTPYTAFWQQALRAMAPSLSRTGAVTLAIEPDRGRYQVGQRVVLHARYQSERPLPMPALQATVSLPDQKPVPIVFTPDPAQANTYWAEFEPTRPGQYRIAADVSSEGKHAADAMAAIDVEPLTGEMSSTAIDDANLTRIAAATGGQRIVATDPSTWPTPAGPSGQRVLQARNLDLWGNFTLLILLCVLLGTDWLLRLLRGYV